ncbi:MAG: DUF2807 domain-containing protein [Chlorobi bacterium]|nr:DUF2807 domain-containing protein [Chlorobiota bacterium]
MKKISYLSVIVLFLLESCVGTPGFTQKKETRNVTFFTRVGLAIAGDLYLTQGDKTEVILEGPEGLLKEIKTDVDGDLLRIKYKSWGPHRGKVNIYITMHDIEGLSVSGSGNIKTQTPIEAKKLSLAVSGSGNIRMDDLDAKDISAKISGSGNINLSGKNEAGSLDVAISGSGDINCAGLPAGDVNVRISGSGDVRVYATKHLKAAVAGSGGIQYKGTPVVDAKVSGSGKVRPVN